MIDNPHRYFHHAVRVSGMASAVLGALKVVLTTESAQFGRNLRAARGDVHKTGHAATASGAALAAFTAALGGIAVAAGRASMALNRGLANVATLIDGGGVDPAPRDHVGAGLAHGDDGRCDPGPRRRRRADPDRDARPAGCAGRADRRDGRQRRGDQ